MTGSPAAALSGQPEFGSCWAIENRYQAIKEWAPTPLTDRHPMGCVQKGEPKRLRASVSLRSVPRTSDLRCRDDPGALWTCADVTPWLDMEGVFLTRYAKAVVVEAFEGFTDTTFRGVLPPNVRDELRDRLLLRDTLQL